MRTLLPFLAGVTLLAVVPALACSTSSSGTLPGDAGMGSNADTGTNPYGVEYPNDNPGISARKGSIPGNQIKNYQFQGYPNGDVSMGLQTVSLADFYDPQGKLGYKLLHLGVAAVWCVPCNTETDAIVPLVASLGQKGVVFAQALDDGAMQGTAATPMDLMSWITKHKTNFTEMLDPNLANLGMFFDASAVPWNAIIDTRTMEILQDGVGYSGNIENDLSPWISWVASNPPSYPVPSP